MKTGNFQILLMSFFVFASVNVSAQKFSFPFLVDLFFLVS